MSDKAIPPALAERLREVARTFRTPDDVKATVRAALTSSHRREIVARETDKA